MYVSHDRFECKVDFVQKKAKEAERSASLRSRFSRTFNRVILRRQDMMNNNGIASGHKRDKTTTDTKMPSIGNKAKEGESTASSVSPITTTASSLVPIYDRESFQ